MNKKILSALLLVAGLTMTGCDFDEPSHNPGGNTPVPSIPDNPGGGGDIPGGGGGDIPGGGDVDTSEDTSSEDSSSDIGSSEDIGGGGIPGGDDTNTDTGNEKDPFALLFTDFQYYLSVAKPTRASTLVNYYVADYDVTLNFNSRLTIEYSNPLKAEYTYTVQHLNPIGSDEMVSSKSGTNYVSGSSVGSLENGQINWNTQVESKVSLIAFNFTEECFELNDKSIQGNTFEAKIKNDQLTAFFNKKVNATNATFTIVLTPTKDKIQTIKLAYTDTKTNAEVESTTTYSEEYYKVNIPGM